MSASSTVEARAARRPRDRAQEARRRLRIEDDRHLDGLDLAGAEPPDDARRGRAADGDRIFDARALARGRVPGVALHLAVPGGDGRDADPEGRRRVAPREAVRGGVDVARTAVVVLGALGVGDAGVALERRGLAAPRDVDLRLGRLVRARVREVEVRYAPDQVLRVGEAGVRVLGRDLRERGRLVDYPLEGLAREVRRRGGRGRATGEDAEGQPRVARVGDRFEVAEPDDGAEGALFDQVPVRRRRALGDGPREDADEQVLVHCSGDREAGETRWVA